MKKIDAGAWVRLLLLLITFVNGLLAANGYEKIELDETTASIIVAGLIALWGLWKDNPFTKKAIQRKEIQKSLKRYEKQ